MIKSPLVSLAVLAALSVTAAACGGGDSGTTKSGAQLVKAGTLTVCSDVPYPPFEDFDKSTPTGFSGFDVDVISGIAEQLKLKLVIKDSDFNALQSGLALNSGQCDLAASAMTITPERQQKLGFSDGYYDSEQSLLVGANSGITSISDLSGVKVGVQKGTTGEAYANEHASDAQIVVFPSDGEMYQALKAGQVDALLQDLPVNLDHQNDPKQAGQWQVVEKYQTDEQYGFAMKKTNTHLISDVDDALAKMKSDGDYDTIYNKYFATN